MVVGEGEESVAVARFMRVWKADLCRRIGDFEAAEAGAIRPLVTAAFNV